MAHSMGKVDRTRHQAAVAEGQAGQGQGRRRDLHEGADTHKPGSLVETTVGRVMFNDILPGHAVLQHTMKSKDLQNVISDCYLEFGRRTIELLDNMKETRLPSRPAAVCRSPPATWSPADQGKVIARSREASAEAAEAVRPRRHHRAGTVQPVSTLDARSRTDHDRDDGELENDLRGRVPTSTRST
jgi:hypothetical protein